MRKTVPIFFSCNDKYVPYLDVAVISIIENSSEDNDYEITVLKTDVSEENQQKLLKHAKDNVKIKFFDVKDIIEPFKNTLPDMFYYTLAAYYRLFIESAFPEYDKAIYLDCDVILLTDIAKLYDIDVDGYLLAAAYEQNTSRAPMFTNYVEEIIGIPYYTYFNSGVMLMNLKEFRTFGVQKRFLEMLTTYNFDCLAPDQEYINVICHGRVKRLPTGWNKHSFPEPPEGDLNLVHYALTDKPWFNKDTINGEYFWQYAKKSEFYDYILQGFKNYTEEDRRKSQEMFAGLLQAIENIKHSDRTFKKLWFDKKADKINGTV